MRGQRIDPRAEGGRQHLLQFRQRREGRELAIGQSLCRSDPEADRHGDGFVIGEQQRGERSSRLKLVSAAGAGRSPELLFLDEPSTGLDPQSRENLWQHILDLRRTHGTTIFVTTHYLDEADRFAERVMVMDHGRVIADDTASALKTTLAGDVITLGFTSEADAAAAVSVTARVTGASVSQNGHQLELTVDHGDALLPSLLRALDSAACAASTARLRQPTLDDVFLALTGRSLRDDSANQSTPELTEEVPA